MWCLQNKEDEWKWNPMFSTGLVSLIRFSRGPAPCQDHTSKGTGEACSQAPGQMSCISCVALWAASSELVKWGRGPERNAVVHSPLEPARGPLDRVTEREGI